MDYANPPCKDASKMSVRKLLLSSFQKKSADQPVKHLPLFMAVAGFPRVAGCIDGSLLLVDSPKLNEKAYVDKNGDHSTNIMEVCGPNFKFFCVTARCPGSTHDSRVMKKSSFFTQWDQNYWRPFRLKPEVASKIILACFTLPNIQKRLGSEEWDLDADNDESDGEDDDVPPGTVQGKDVHSSLVRMFAAE
ncbi:hypothetical protein ILUMI_04680 [Ignelater luminosus]|uniref:DDE Tnp4 domain-containing protein n=1 Tax=Ignelater luminosus TaxID=2038154 RepID=A0A8K0GH39_IGNLU|nr:hypothetical protein ILUMI_04680 [Ignelater luminosus]